ncbi:MAG: hypothetical protein HYT47_00680 [Candidatus Vogelbacteria bacterium]|nr:hypothetical protein [Candidatus Vogelbacteria bacterium]
MAQTGTYFVYYNFLFYLVLIPFTYIQPLFISIKLYAVIIAALSFTIVYWCCLRLNIKHSLIWVGVIFALTNHTAVWRLFLSRPYALAPAVLLLLLVFLNRKNYWGVFAVNFLYLFWHSATFFFPLGVSLVYFIAQRFYREKLDRKNLIIVIGGFSSAFILMALVSTGFLEYIKEIIFGVFRETVVSKKVILAEGAELYPKDFFDFLRNNSLIISGLLLAGGAEIYQYLSARFRNHGRENFFSTSVSGRSLQLTLFFLTIGTWLGTTAVSGRFGDFFMFFAALYLIVALESLRRFISISDLFVRRGILIGLSVMLIYLFAGNILFLQQILAHGTSVDEMTGVGEWLKNNTQPGELVFNANWSWFPQLFFHSPRNYYVAGLEPRFFYVYDKRLYWLWWNLAVNGYVCEAAKCDEKTNEQRLAFKRELSKEEWVKTEAGLAVEILSNDLQSRYIVSSRAYPLLNTILNDSSRFKRMYYDQSYVIYEVLATLDEKDS